MGGPQFQPTECFVTLKMAMKICMTERTDKGEFCREFFFNRSVEYKAAKLAGMPQLPVAPSVEDML